MPYCTLPCCISNGIEPIVYLIAPMTAISESVGLVAQQSILSVDDREKLLYSNITQMLDLDESAKDDVDNLNSLLAQVTLHDFNQSQKEQFAKLMGQMIIVDKDINYNEVKIYNVVNDFCNIRLEFDMDSYPEYTRSEGF